MNAVDTNVFVYALDDNEPDKRAKARELLDRFVQHSTATQLPWQVAAEFLGCLRKWESAGRITRADVEAHFQDILAMFPLCIPTAKVFRISSDLRTRFSLSHWDSMLLAHARKVASPRCIRKTWPRVRITAA